MQYSLANWQEIAAEMVPEWTRRSNSTMLQEMGPGCFIWEAKEHGISGTGMYYRRDMVRKYFGDEMGGDLEQMIDAADHDSQIIVALIFDKKAIGACLAKSDEKTIVETQPTIMHQLTFAWSYPGMTFCFVSYRIYRSTEKRGKSITCRPAGSKDLADAVEGVVYGFTQDQRLRTESGAVDRLMPQLGSIVTGWGGYRSELDPYMKENDPILRAFNGIS